MASFKLRIEAAGNKQWARTFGNRGQDGAKSVQQTTDGGFVIAGSTNLFIIPGWTGLFWAGETDFWLIKTDADGNAR